MVLQRNFSWKRYSQVLKQLTESIQITIKNWETSIFIYGNFKKFASLQVKKHHKRYVYSADLPKYINKFLVLNYLQILCYLIQIGITYSNLIKDRIYISISAKLSGVSQDKMHTAKSPNKNYAQKKVSIISFMRNMHRCWLLKLILSTYFEK